MHIVLDVSSYFEWEPLNEAEVAALKEDKPKLDADLQALRLKYALNGDLLRKVLIEAPSQTFVDMPEAQIVDCMEHFKRVGSPKSRAQTAAWYLSEKTMPHNAHAGHITRIEVEQEPEVEKFLNSYFSISSEER